jgi:hypothetical protein
MVRLPAVTTGFCVLLEFWANSAAFPVPGRVLSAGPQRPGREPDHLHLVSKLRMNGALTLLPHLSSWHGQGLNIACHVRSIFAGLPK